MLKSLAYQNARLKSRAEQRDIQLWSRKQRHAVRHSPRDWVYSYPEDADRRRAGGYRYEDTIRYTTPAQAHAASEEPCGSCGERHPADEHCPDARSLPTGVGGDLWP